MIQYLFVTCIIIYIYSSHTYPGHLFNLVIITERKEEKKRRPVLFSDFSFRTFINRIAK